MRRDYRDFRTDRIEKLDIIPGKFSKTDHPSLQNYLDQLQQGTDVQIVTIRFQKKYVRYIEEIKYQYVWVAQTESGGYVDMKFAIMGMEFLARWLLMQGKNFQVVSPESLKSRIKELIQELSNAHS